MPADNPPRRVTITKAPFDFEHSRLSVQAFTANGEFLLPGRVCDFIVAKGYGHEGWASDSKTRTVKSGPRRRRGATSRAKSVKPAGNAETTGTDTAADVRMGRADVSKAHRAVAGQPLADSAE